MSQIHSTSQYFFLTDIHSTVDMANRVNALAAPLLDMCIRSSPLRHYPQGYAFQVLHGLVILFPSRRQTLSHFQILFISQAGCYSIGSCVSVFKLNFSDLWLHWHVTKHLKGHWTRMISDDNLYFLPCYRYAHIKLFRHPRITSISIVGHFLRQLEGAFWRNGW